MGILSITLSDRPGNVIKLHKQDSYQEETFHAKRDQRKTLSIKKDFYNDKLSVKGKQHGCMEDFRESNDLD